MYKEHKLVMLPTNEKASNIVKILSDTISYTTTLDIPGGIYQHLYILSDEEIKEGDWFIYNKKLYNRIKRSGLECTVKIEMFENFEHAEQFGYKDTWVEVYKSDCKKIIACTDKLRLICKDEFGGIDNQHLPQIPQSFIEHFVSEYNKGNVIAKVMVKYKDYSIPGGVKSYISNTIVDISCKLLINQDNTINIKPIKDIFSREEVISICKKLLLATGKEIKTTMHFNKSFVEFEGSDVDKWIKENL